MNTTLPFHAAVETGLPSRSFTKNAGIGCGCAAKRTTWASSARSVVVVLRVANSADDGDDTDDALDDECAAPLRIFIARGVSERLAARPIARPASPATIASTKIKDLFIRRPAPATHYGPDRLSEQEAKRARLRKSIQQTKRRADSIRDADSQ